MTRLEDLSEAEISRRVPVWTALAEFYVDTELQDFTLRYIARVVRTAGYTLDEAKSMLKYEVGPVFFWNLLAPAGNWAGWPEDFVRDRVLQRLGWIRLWERVPLWRDLWYRLQASATENQWARIAVHYAAEEAA